MLLTVPESRNERRPRRVAVIGAGPAGAWTARLLARSGMSVTIFDGSHPREKPCGGGLTRRATQLIVRELGAFPVPGVAVRSASFESAAAAGCSDAATADGGIGADGRRRAEMSLPGERGDRSDALLVVSRAAFDRALLESARRAGATFVDTRVVEIAVGETGVVVTTADGAWQADLVIGADGANSLVRRRVAAPFSRAQLSVGAGWYVHGRSGDDIAIRWITGPAGYLWSFPRPDHLAVGACAEATEVHGAAELKTHVEQWLRDNRMTTAQGGSATTPPVTLEPYSWPIPALSAGELTNGLPLAGDRWMLVGDAAGLVDPLTREGIYWALYSAELAASALIDDQGGTAARYRQSIAEDIVPELARAAGLKRRFFTPAMSDAVVRALTRSAGIRRIMGDLIAGEQPYVGLKRRLAATGRIDLALDLLWRMRG